MSANVPMASTRGVPPQRINLVEDDGDYLGQAYDALAQAGHEVWFGSGFSQAISSAEQDGVRCFIVDLRLRGELEGLDIVYRLKQTYGDAVFVAVVTNVDKEVESLSPTRQPDITVRKESPRTDCQKVLVALDAWLASRSKGVGVGQVQPIVDSAGGVDLAGQIFPSDDLACRVLGLELKDLAALLMRRNEQAARVGAEPLSGIGDLRREIGNRQREEMRLEMDRLISAGLLVEGTELVRAGRLAEVLARGIVTLLPLSYDAGVILDEFAKELLAAASVGRAFPWGDLRRDGDSVSWHCSA